MRIQNKKGTRIAAAEADLRKAAIKYAQTPESLIHMTQIDQVLKRAAKVYAAAVATDEAAKPRSPTT